MRKLKLVLVVVAALLIGLLPGLAGAVTKEASKGGQSVGAGVRYGLELDGVFVGWLDSVAGGNATAEVLEKLGSDQIARKHIGNVKYEDITVTFGSGMSKEFYQWVQASFDHKHSRKNGAIIAADYNRTEIARMTFTQASLSEVGFPALDAASKDAAKMTTKFRPERTRRAEPTGKQLPPSNQRDQKQWLPANFRIRINDIETRITRIDAIVIKQMSTDNPADGTRGREQEPASMEIPNLVVSWAESVGDNPLFQGGGAGSPNSLFSWHERFVTNGANEEKSATLDYLDNEGKPLFTLTFAHLGIFKLAPDKAEANSEGVRRVTAEMYCEEIGFSFIQ